MSYVATEETVDKRAHLFVPVDLKADGFNCVDDQASDWKLYAHIGGGVASVAYTRMLMAHLTQPGSAAGFAATTADTIGILETKGYRHQGVHSSVGVEGSHTPQLQQSEGDVGCGYTQLRRAISQGIAHNGRSIIERAGQLFPDLFDNEADAAFAWQVVGAHEWFSAEPARIDPGRAVFLTATGRGAEAMLVRGGHAADEGIINTQHGTTFDNNAAVEEGLPCYDNDLWANGELLAEMPEEHDERQVAIATVIDVIGTYDALGVKHIAVR